MTDLQNLLERIEWLDKAATPGPWVKDKSQLYDYVEPHPYDLYEAGEDDPPLASDILPHNAEFIALARTFAPAASRALRAVIKLHRPETRWSYEPAPDMSFSSKAEVIEWYDLDNEPHDPADVTTFQLCTLCAEIEQGAAEDLGHLTAIYPCPTVQAIHDEIGDDDAE